MKIHYLEIVANDADAVCAAYSAAHGLQFGEPDASLGNARTAALPGGGMAGVRQPLHPAEEPVVRPYWLVSDINAAVAVPAGDGPALERAIRETTNLRAVLIETPANPTLRMTDIAAAVRAGAEVIHPPLEIPAHGTFAIYTLGGNQHGLWER